MSQGGAGDKAGFAGLLAGLRVFRAGPLGGDPSDRALARAAGVSPDTIGKWLAGTRFPQDEDKFLVVVRAVAARAAARCVAPGDGAAGLLDEEAWRRAYRAEARRRAGVVSAGVQRAQAARALAGPAAGRLLDQVTDPFALEVHRPVHPEDAPPGLPVLPPYLPREHDQVLGQVMRAAAAGRSQVAVLVGGSSTGKTRACWEALARLRHQDLPWRVWHPIDPSRPEAALAELPGIGPRTVVWLNEAQFYLDPSEAGLGERVAAGLRELLRDPGRAPVLVLATLWPKFWDALTARPPDGGADPHAQARELLAGHDIPVPPALTPAQAGQLARAGDVRLALAARSAPNGEVIQFLAGAPELLARYRNAPPAAAALIHAAMDARRLGMGAGLPQAFLEAAAPGYLTDDQWDSLGEDWAEQALAYTAVPCKGVRGPLTRIRPRPARPAARAQPDGLYRLADYLDQYGRARRASQIPPAEFWTAAAAHAASGDQAVLGDAAIDRGLYRDAAQLHKNAAAHGHPRAIDYLSQPPDRLTTSRVIFRIHWAPYYPGDFRVSSYLREPPDCLNTDPRSAQWAAAHAALDDPAAVSRLLDRLREAGAHQQAAALLARDPAAHAPLDDPAAVSRLLDSLWEAGAHQQAAALADRAAAHTALDDPIGVDRLLHILREAGAHQQAAALADRAAAHTALDDPAAVADLLIRLWAAGAHQQAAALLARDPAAHAPLDDPAAVADLLVSLWAAGAHQQAAALLARDPAAHAALDDPGAVARLLDKLRAAGAHQQAAALLARDPAAHAALHDPGAVADLLVSLRAAGAHQQAAALADRAAAHAALDDPIGVDRLLRILREAGAHQQAAALADRAAAHTPLGNPADVAVLLARLQDAGAHQQAAALADRAAAHTPLGNPIRAARLLDSLQDAGAHQQAAALADRAAAHAPLGNPADVAVLLDSLQDAGAHQQAAALADRAAAHTPLDDPIRAARLLDSLQDAGAHQQAAALADRLPTAGMFKLYLEWQGCKDQFRFGREADGSPARPWGWEDLDL